LQVKVDSQVVNGRLSRNRQSLKTAIEQFEGKNVTITIEKTRSKRSNDQNRYYWSGVVPIVHRGLKDAGYAISKDDTHLAMRAKFLSEPIPMEDGTYIDKFKSTTELTKSEFSDYIESIRDWAFDYLGVTIPPPNTHIELL